jgi:hypothetical protein
MEPMNRGADDVEFLVSADVQKTTLWDDRQQAMRFSWFTFHKRDVCYPRLHGFKIM